MMDENLVAAWDRLRAGQMECSPAGKMAVKLVAEMGIMRVGEMVGSLDKHSVVGRAEKSVGK